MTTYPTWNRLLFRVSRGSLSGAHDRVTLSAWPRRAIWDDSYSLPAAYISIECAASGLENG